MKKIVLLLTCLFLLTPAFSQAKPAKAASDTAEIRQQINEVWATWSTMDVKAVSNFYVKDADAMFFDIAPMKYNGWSEYEKGVSQLLTAYSALNIKVNDDARVHRIGNTAWVSATLSGTSTSKDGKTEKMDMRWTSIWEKRGGQWLIVHEHVSMPQG